MSEYDLQLAAGIAPTRMEDLERVLRDAVVAGYHACDERIPAIDEPPRGGCRCWVQEGKLLLGMDND